MTKREALLEEFSEALQRLEDALRQSKSDFMRDSAIKRFELAFDLAWKVIKAHLEERGIRCTSPLGCFKEAFTQKLLDHDKAWLDMVKTRNYTVHTYNEDLAEEVYRELPNAASAFQKLLAALKKP